MVFKGQLDISIDEGERFGSIEAWAVNFVQRPSPLLFDRRRGRQPNGAQPSEGLLAPQATAFEVLLVQLRLGGLVPGFPNSFLNVRLPARLIFQNLGAFDLANFQEYGDFPYGIAFLQKDLIDLERQSTSRHSGGSSTRPCGVRWVSC
jgi:hypothetical protein